MCDNRLIIPEEIEQLVYDHLKNVGESEELIIADGYEVQESEIETDFAIESEPLEPSFLDNGKYLIRYKYIGPRDSKNRKFCADVLDLNLIYRKEDINMMSFRTENKQFGTYSIFDYKGSYGCRHNWQRIVYKKDKNTISKGDIPGTIKIPSNKIPKSYIPKDGKATQKNENLVEQKQINMAKIPVYEFTINPNDEEAGMMGISLVDKPAMESSFIALAKEEKPKPKYIFKDEKKHIVCGLALIPDKLVNRIDVETGQEYLGYFSQSTIEMIRDKFMKDQNTKNVNLQHDMNQTISAYMVESYILNSQTRVDEVKAMGIEDATIGSWFVSYKIEDEKAYQDALNGNFKGFSAEVILEKHLKLNKNNSKNNNFMNKMNKLISKFKTLLNEFENENLEDAKIAGSELMIRFTEVGMPVQDISMDAEGKEVVAPTKEGEYVLEDGRTIKVGADSNLIEVVEASNEPVAPVADEILEVVAEPVASELAVSGDTSTDVPVVTGGVESKTIGEIVDVNKDGEYYICVEVQNGAIVKAEVAVEQSLIPAQEMMSSQSKVTELEANIVELKAQLEKPVTKPAVPQITSLKAQTKTKDEISKMNNLEFHLYKLGLDK